MDRDGVHPASFRDPAGFLFVQDGVLYRHVAPVHARDYDALLASGLYDELTRTGRLVRHEETDQAGTGAHRILRPERVPFVSYPYEWCFSALREAALLTLDLLQAALDRGMVLRDASPFNVQFVGTRPVFVDTLSFGAYEEGRPWAAYRQFCEQFLAPLALMSHVDARLSGLWRQFLDGMPLDLASRLLPRRSWARFGLLTHLHLHARAQSELAERTSAAGKARVPRARLRDLARSLRNTVAGLPRPAAPSAWADYESTHGYTPESSAHKEEVVARWLAAARPGTVWDLGSNVGRFSRLALREGAMVIAFDGDARVVDDAYRSARREGSERILPLLMDLCNPSPGLGWEGREREPLDARGPADLVMALALVHHLALARNVPLPRIAAWLRRLAPAAIVEFVPRDDPQARRLLGGREDLFTEYTRPAFEEAFSALYGLAESEPLRGSDRVLYWWRSA